MLSLTGWLFSLAAAICATILAAAANQPILQMAAAAAVSIAIALIAIRERQKLKETGAPTSAIAVAKAKARQRVEEECIVGPGLSVRARFAGGIAAQSAAVNEAPHRKPANSHKLHLTAGRSALSRRLR